MRKQALPHLVAGLCSGFYQNAVLQERALQGLDYFAADGSQPFDILIDVVRLVSELGAERPEWETNSIDILKTAKYQRLPGKIYFKITMCHFN